MALPPALATIRSRPAKAITRQEMFTLLYNALKAINQLPVGTAGTSLSAFSDSNENRFLGQGRRDAADGNRNHRQAAAASCHRWTPPPGRTWRSYCIICYQNRNKLARIPKNKGVFEENRVGGRTLFRAKRSKIKVTAERNKEFHEADAVPPPPPKIPPRLNIYAGFFLFPITCILYSPSRRPKHTPTVKINKSSQLRIFYLLLLFSFLLGLYRYDC